MRKLAVMVMSFVAAAMLGGAAVLTAVMPVRAADITGIEAVEAMFETENTAAFSTSGGKNNVVVTQANDMPVTSATPGTADATHNQTTTITYKNPIYIGDNSDEVPVFTYSWMDRDNDTSKRDFDALIVTLTDTEDATNQVSVLIGAWCNAEGWQNTSSSVYAKGSGQTYLGYHYASATSKSFGAPVNQGTMTDGAIDKYPGTEWEIYYDNDSKQVLINYGWPNYSSRGGVVTNEKGKQLTIVRDLTDTATSGADSIAYTAGMETAYLSVTTVRGWFAYNDIGTSTIYSSAFRSGSSSAHTLSDKGAQYMIRSIDGLNFGLTDGTMADSEPLYFAESFSGSGAAEIPVLNRYTVLGGIEEDKAYTEGLYIKVENQDAESVTVQGLSDGKWTEGCGFAGENGTYTVNYYADSAYETLVASVTVTLYRPAFDTAEEITAPDVFEGEGSTFGWEIFRVGNTPLYSGVTVSTAAAGSVTYKKDIDISDNTANDVLLEFIAIPNEVGVHDFTSITFKFIDKNDPTNFLTVILAGGSSANLGGLRAGGSNQDLYGLKYIRKNNEYDPSYGTGISQNLAGQGNGSIPYSTISFYYDKKENALYVSPAYDYTNSAAIKQLVRDFDDTTLITNKEGDTVSQEAWNGFTGNSVTLEITVNTVAEGKTAKYGVLTVDGERLTKRLDTEFLFDGIVGYEYALPTPTYVSGLTGAETNFSSVASGVRVLYNGEEVDVLGGVFTPKNAGEYTVQYAVEEGGTTYMAEFTLTVFAQDQAPAVEFDITGGLDEGDVIYLGGGIQGSVSAATALHHDGSACDVTVQIFKGEAVLQTFENGEFSYDFDEVGDYTLVFTAVDKVGRQSVREIPFAVSRTSIEIAEPDDEQTLLDRSDKIVFSASDVKVSDVRIENGATIATPQKDFASLDVSISYSYKDGAFSKWTQDSDMSALGDYKIKYTVSYTLESGGETYGSEYVRTVKVVDNTAPALDEAKTPEGKVQADTSQSTDSALYYKALKGGEISISQLGATDARGDRPFDLSGEVEVKLTDADGDVTDAVFAEGKFTFTPNKAGTYYVTFTVSDGVLEDTLVYVFEVKNVWLNASFESDTLADAVFGTAYELPVPVLTDFNGGAVTDAQITVEIIPESGTPFTVENYTFTPDQTGTFTVRYTIVSNDESAVKEFALTVKDTTAPVIVFDGEVPKTAEAGDTVVLPAVKITDDRDGVLGYRIWLEFEGERTELFDLSFRAEKVGTYKIIVETSDTAGNPAEISAEITVTERSESGGGCSGTLFAGAGMAGAAVAMAAALLLKKKKKANR